MHKMRRAFSAGRIPYGAFTALKDPGLVEIFGYAGYDFIIIDLEHSALDLGTMENMLRAAQVADITAVVRTPQDDCATILRVVEAGADAVMVPHLLSREQGIAIVNMAKYHPIGRRGLDGSTRVAKYGNTPLAEHMRRENERILVIGMIEDREAVDNIKEIVTVPGLDLLFMGPADLSASYGFPGEVTHPLVRKGIETVVKEAKAAGIRVGLGAYDAEQAKKLVALGAGWILSPMIDTLFITDALKRHLTNIKGE